MNKNRINDFSEKTRKKIIKNSGGRCSVRGCHKYIDNGYVSHIYPSSESGPQRSFLGVNKTLNNNDYKSAANGIYTCRGCAEIIDNKSSIKDYPAIDLILFKAIAEFTTRIINKYEDASFHEKHKGYIDLVSVVWDVINEDCPEIDFGLEINRSKEEAVLKKIRSRIFFVDGDVIYENRIKRLSSFKKTIKYWSARVKEWSFINETVEKVSWRAVWCIRINHQEELLPKYIWGQVNRCVFDIVNNINAKDKKDNRIIYFSVIDNSIFNFKFDFEAFDNGTSKCNLIFYDIENLVLSTFEYRQTYAFITHLELIKIILADDDYKVKIYISDEQCSHDDTNSGTLEVEVGYKISEKAKISYRKIINLTQKILSIKNDLDVNFILNFKWYLKFIKEADMISALDTLGGGNFQSKIHIGVDSKFEYFLKRDTNMLVYRIVRCNLSSSLAC